VVVPLPSDFVFKNENERTIYAESLTILDATLKKFFDQYPTAAALDEAVRRSNLTERAEIAARLRKVIIPNIRRITTLRAKHPGITCSIRTYLEAEK
jgi:hypothetical protein